MRIQVRPAFFKQHSRGYAALAMVAVLGVSALLSLMYVFRGAVRSHESQVRNQLKVDYRQKEDAILRALVAITPNKAIGAMKSNSVGDASGINGSSQYGWEEIFARAIADANAGTALNSAVVTSFGISGIINANTGDISGLVPSDFVNVIAGGGTFVGPGTTANTALLTDSDVGSKLPQALAYTGSYTTDQGFPIISKDKIYPSTTTGLGASATNYPLYNLIPYPNIRFGYAAQGQNFIAKRNWWAFSLTFGRGVNLTNNTGTSSSAVPTVTKDYILSIYEVPAQLALSAGAKLQLGTYANGGAWQNTTITGRAFGSEVVTGGNLNMEGITARRKINIGGTTSLGGVSIADGFDALGVRETRWKTAGSDFYGASTAGESGKVAILPLSQGAQFIRRAGTAPSTNALSSTGWDDYAMGARQCAMQIEISKASAVVGEEHRPIEVIFHYKTPAGGDASVTFVPGANWENYNRDFWVDTATGATSIIPFYWENLTLNGNPSLSVKLDRFPAFLANLVTTGATAAADLRTNHSLSIWSNPAGNGVSLPSIPSRAIELGVVIRDGEDLVTANPFNTGLVGLRGFERGFSVVTDHRVYLVGNLNQTTGPIPNGSGIPAGTPYYPPLSIFASDKRFGTGAGSITGGNIRLDGQLTSLADDGSTVNPLDLRTGTADGAGAVSGNQINANLAQIVSPAQLPPVNKMTWMVVVEEIGEN